MMGIFISHIFILYVHLWCGGHLHLAEKIDVLGCQITNSVGDAGYEHMHIIIVKFIITKPNESKLFESILNNHIT